MFQPLRQNKKQAQQRADAKRAGRTRNFATVVYPESAPADWMDKLPEQLVEALVSPLHDKDVWNADDEAENASHRQGEPKKAHWHIVLSFTNPTTYETVKEVELEYRAEIAESKKTQQQQKEKTMPVKTKSSDRERAVDHSRVQQQKEKRLEKLEKVIDKIVNLVPDKPCSGACSYYPSNAE